MSNFKHRGDKLISISELAKNLNLKNRKNSKYSTHTLRFWEKEFKQIKPMMLSGRRYYSKKDIEIISFIKHLLKDQGLTIQGVKKILDKKNNSLDASKQLSITSDYFKNKIKIKSKKLLSKIKNLKK
tara:strand:+ start:1281 stop:1661 length:381 start_codon:yes stop_codon:yes gene_type:complete